MDLIGSTGASSRGFEHKDAPVGAQLSLAPGPPAWLRPHERLTNLSVSALVQLARCPKQFYWTVVQPLPRSPSEKARLGHLLHRWIEVRSAGQQCLDVPRGPSEGVEEGDVAMARLQRSFEASRFSKGRPRHVEQRFTLGLPGGYLVGGRIDAVFTHDDGKWEVVDYKTGHEPQPGDSTRLQLSIYALAARRIWGIDPRDLSVTFFYLTSGRIDSTPATDLTTDESDLVALFEQVHAGGFDPSPGPFCDYCDFREFCDEGRAYLATGVAGA